MFNTLTIFMMHQIMHDGEYRARNALDLIIQDPFEN
jgi:hypothetical protein